MVFTGRGVMNKIGFDFDFIVVGSGFGGSVSALRLSEKGYDVAVLEKGKRWQKDDFPKTNWMHFLRIMHGGVPGWR
jgi:choline dehydrogenase-like flavoprotein